MIVYGCHFEEENIFNTQYWGNWIHWWRDLSDFIFNYLSGCGEDERTRHAAQHSSHLLAQMLCNYYVPLQNLNVFRMYQCIDILTLNWFFFCKHKREINNFWKVVWKSARGIHGHGNPADWSAVSCLMAARLQINFSILFLSHSSVLPLPYLLQLHNSFISLH